MKDIKIIVTKQSGDNNKAILDLYDNTSLSINYELIDLQDLNFVNTNYSFSFRIPNTRNNNNIFDIQNINFEYSPYIKLYIELLLDDYNIFNGHLVLNKIININENIWEYEVTIYDILNDVLKTIKDEKLIGNDNSNLDILLDTNIKISTYTHSNINKYQRLKDTDDNIFVIPNTIVNRIQYEEDPDNYNINNYKYYPSVSMTEIFFKILEGKGITITNKSEYFNDNIISLNSYVNTDIISKIDYSDVLVKDYYLNKLEPVVNDIYTDNVTLKESISYNGLGNIGSGGATYGGTFSNLVQFYNILLPNINGVTYSTKDYILLNDNLGTSSTESGLFFTSDSNVVMSTYSKTSYYNNRNKYITNGKLDFNNEKTYIDGYTYSLVINSQTFSYSDNEIVRNNNFYKRNILIEKNKIASYASSIIDSDGKWNKYIYKPRPYTDYITSTVSQYDPNRYTQVMHNDITYLGTENVVGFDTIEFNFDNRKSQELNEKATTGYFYINSLNDWNNEGANRVNNIGRIKIDSDTRGWYTIEGVLNCRLEIYDSVNISVPLRHGTYSFSIDTIIKRNMDNFKAVDSIGSYSQYLENNPYDRYETINRTIYEFNTDNLYELDLYYNSYDDALYNATSSGTQSNNILYKNKLYVMPTIQESINSTSSFYLDDGDELFLVYKNNYLAFQPPVIPNNPDEYGIYIKGQVGGDEFGGYGYIEEHFTDNIHWYPIVESGNLNLIASNENPTIQTKDDGSYLMRGTISFLEISGYPTVPFDSYLIATKYGQGLYSLGYNDWATASMQTYLDSNDILYYQPISRTQSSYTFSFIFESNQEDILNNNISFGVITRGEYNYPYFNVSDENGLTKPIIASGSSYQLYHYSDAIHNKYPNIVSDRSFYLNDEETKLEYCLKYLKLHNLYLVKDKLENSFYSLKPYNILYDEENLVYKKFDFDSNNIETELNTDYIKKEYNFKLKEQDNDYIKKYFKIVNKVGINRFDKYIKVDNLSNNIQDFNFDIEPVIFYLNDNVYKLNNIGFCLDKAIYVSATQSTHSLFTNINTNQFEVKNGIYYNDTISMLRRGDQVNYVHINRLDPNQFITNNLNYTRLQNKPIHIFSDNLKYYNIDLLTQNYYTYYYNQQISDITNPRVIKVNIKMSNKDFNDLLLNDIIVLEINGFIKKFKILKIEDYDPFDISDLITFILLEI